MKIKTTLGAAVLATAMLASPVMATTFNIATDLTNPVFVKGSVAGTTVTSLTQQSCADVAVIGTCYRGGETYQLIAISNDDANTLLVHPGAAEASNSALLFVAPRAGDYTFNFTFNKVNTGDGIQVFKYLNGLTGGTAVAAGASYTLSYVATLAQGELSGFAINRGGASQDYYGDSTNVVGSVTGAVPEPATWAMMILGMGAVGVAMRRRKAVRTSVRYA